MLHVMLLPDWLRNESPTLKPLQGEFSYEELLDFNDIGYNIYYYPNYPAHKDSTSWVKGHEIDSFEWVFVDLDMKHGAYGSKAEFVSLLQGSGLPPTKIIDSGGGIHAYWKVTDLDAMSFLKLGRRLCRKFNTDEAVTKIKQLMRLPDTLNTKIKGEFKLCKTLHDTNISYTAEQLDTFLGAITNEDEDFCQRHYAETYSLEDKSTKVDDKLPIKFAHLLNNNKEVKEIWSGNVDDRSKGDYRLGHIMFASGFTKDEAASVLVNSAKALVRGPNHRVGYAMGIVEKIWVYEETTDKDSLTLSSSVKSILNRSHNDSKGARLLCWKYFDDTVGGFRLGHVIGLVGGSGVGKTATALNMFLGFVQNNPDYDHFFVSLEQPEHEIADHWRVMCGDRTELYEKVHIIGNYNEDGTFRDLSLSTIQDYVLKFQTTTKKKIGCVVIDHIAVLANDNKLGQDEGVKKLCKAMKAFALQTNTLLIMQSQTSREKAGIGDLELNKDAAFGTSVFENFCDYLITLWQPLKRCYAEGAPTCLAFKFAKIRHKKQGQDAIQEDVCYRLYFDSKTEQLRELTQAEEKSFVFFLQKSTNKRKQDRKTDIIDYVSIRSNGVVDGKINSNQDIAGFTTIKEVPDGQRIRLVRH